MVDEDIRDPDEYTRICVHKKLSDGTFWRTCDGEAVSQVWPHQVTITRYLTHPPEMIPQRQQQQQGHSPPSESTPYTVTISIGGGFGGAGVISLLNHGLSKGHAVVFATSGALPTGLTAGTTYYVVPDQNFNDNQFAVAATQNGPAIVTSGSQSGTQTQSQPTNTFRVLRLSKVVTETYVIAANAIAAKAAARLLGNEKWARRHVRQYPSAVSAGPGNANTTGTEDVFEYDTVSSDDGL